MLSNRPRLSSETRSPEQVEAEHATALDDLLTAVHQQLCTAESTELFHLGVEDTRLFAAGVLSAYADGRLRLTVECRRAAIRLLRDY
jgi:hypothetical protein